MTSLLANRSARRRGIAYTVLLAVTLLMMAFSSNPGVREFQNGIGFAFRPIQGALDQVAGGIASIGAAITEVDRLRIDNAALRDENARLANENARLQGTRRENDQLTALLQLQSGFDFKTTAASVIGRESMEFRRIITLDKGTNAGLAAGDVVIANGGALAGRITDIGPDSATVVLLTDSEFDRDRPAVVERRDRPGRRSAGRRAGHDPDRLEHASGAQRRGRDSRPDPRERDPLAVPEGSADRPGRGRSA